MELCVIDGDGIGAEVVPAALKVLTQVVPNITTHTARAGWDCFQATGTSLPDETVELTKQCGAVLFGAAQSPSYPVKGYFSPIVRLRRIMKTHANLRPTTYLPVPAAREGVDLIVVRENTEDLYVGDEESDGEVGTAKKVITRVATERVSHTAFQLARTAHRKKVTIVHKSNVMPQTDGLFRRVAFEVASQYPDIETDELLVDTAAYWLVKDPLRFDVILTGNLYGDILSDMAAAWGGGLGLAPALNLGADIAIAEPVHGSAPDIAGKGVANPTAAFLSVAMLARYYWKLGEAADRIERAVYGTLNDKIYTADIIAEGAVGTAEFTQQVIDRL